MKKLGMFLSAMVFVTQAHCIRPVPKDFLTVENASNRILSFAPIQEVGEFYLSKTVTINPGEIKVFKHSELPFAGFTVALDGESPEKVYLKKHFKARVRLTDLNLREFFKLKK